MKAQVINTDFLHDGTYYKQNSIINMLPDIVKKYPSNLLAVIEPINESKDQEINIDENISSEMIQDNSNLSAVADANNMIINTKVSKKNKRGKKC